MLLVSDSFRAHRPAVVFVAVFLLAVVRNPLLWRSQFIFEEAGAYWAMSFAQGPIDFLFDTWVGYLTVVSRMVFLAGHLVPYALVPAFERIVEDGLVAGVAAFFVSGRLSRAIPDGIVRAAFGCSLALLPVADHMGSILQAHWILSIFLVGLSLTHERRWFDYPLGVLAVLSGLPAAIAVAPFWLRRPDKLTILLTAVAAIQLELGFLAARSHFPLDLEGLAMRFGWTGVVATMLVIASVRRVPVRPTSALGVVAIVTLLAGAVATTNIETPGLFERYFIVSWATVAFIGIAAASRTSWAGVALVGLVGIASLSPLARTFQPAPYPDTDWPGHSDCIGGPTQCWVPIYPRVWSVEWPGDPGLYIQPRNLSGH